MRCEASTLGVKKIIIFTLIIFLSTSCSGRNEDQSMVEETGEIIEGYIDTLEGSIGDAKDVRDLMNQNQDKLKDNLNNIY
ncbi:MAG: hypothetical protein QM490_05060 [Candidatus Gracilibacteria bacterium]